MKKEAIIFDIDGTLAKMGDRSPYDWKKVGIDTPHQDILDLLHDLRYKDNGDIATIIIVTGRLEVCRKQTEEWLSKYGVDYDHLYMREMTEEFDKDVIIKKRIYEDYITPKYEVKYVFDDRDQTVEGWRSLGLRCLQVAPGDF